MNNQSSSDVICVSSQAVILHSSVGLGWQTITVEQCYHPAGEYAHPVSASHMLCLHQGSVLHLEHVKNGGSFARIEAAGNLHIIPAGVENTWRYPVGMYCLHVLLAADLLQRVAEDCGQPYAELMAQFCDRDARVEHICSALLAEMCEGGTSGRLYADGLAIALAAHLTHTYTRIPLSVSISSRGLSTPTLQRVTSFIEDHLTEDLMLTDLASEAGMSSSHFSCLFRKATRLSPHQYVVQCRLERAQHLLKSTNLSINEIAHLVGFYDQSHLVRHMQRVMGVTPTSLRKDCVG